MNRLALSTTMLAVHLISGCNGGGLSKDPCRVELETLTMSDSVTINMERLVDGIAKDPDSERYWNDIPTITTGCQAPAVLPDQRFFGSGTSSHAPKPIQLVRFPDFFGAVFVYPSQGEEEVVTGVAAALVTYRTDGRANYVYKAAETLRYEGAGIVTTSTLSSESVRRCLQKSEYAKYAENGDIIGRLEVPYRSLRFCENIMLRLP